MSGLLCDQREAATKRRRGRLTVPDAELVERFVTAGIMAGFGTTPEVLGCHPVYLATAIGSGSVVGFWMNDSGFWIFARMSGLTEVETLKTWTVQLTILGITLLLAWLMPMV